MVSDNTRRMCERSARQQQSGCLLTDLLVLGIHGERVVLIRVSHARALLAELFLLAIDVPAVALPGHVPIAASDAILQVIELCQCPALLDTCSGVKCISRQHVKKDVWIVLVSIMNCCISVCIWACICMSQAYSEEARPSSPACCWWLGGLLHRVV